MDRRFIIHCSRLAGKWKEKSIYPTSGQTLRSRCAFILVFSTQIFLHQNGVYYNGFCFVRFRLSYAVLLLLLLLKVAHSLTSPFGVCCSVVNVSKYCVCVRTFRMCVCIVVVVVVVTFSANSSIFSQHPSQPCARCTPLPSRRNGAYMWLRFIFFIFYHPQRKKRVVKKDTRVTVEGVTVEILPRHSVHRLFHSPSGVGVSVLGDFPFGA